MTDETKPAGRAFADLREFHDPDLLLTINGKTYRIPSPSASEGLKIRQLFAAEMIGDATELDHIAKILGAQWQPDVQQVPVLDIVTGDPVLDEAGEPVIEERDLGTWSGGVWSEMDADGVSWEEIMHAGRTALIDVGMGRVVAETHWVAGMAPAMDLPEIDEIPEDDPGNPRPVEPNRAARRAKNKKKHK
ncbi:hypothetical protein MYK68_15885 [Gordonia sp. PP30]|uniref:DUF7426 family protein n=1 Tax=Gordonia sp. PP30 TaxID=2935861 RepID=UPI001FFFAE53|nr:hypothetical protein [Gordonia sp. PP30]UQE74191.1 hypothetical protein MYK68_15885 [Gordonia sp. PP30]